MFTPINEWGQIVYRRSWCQQYRSYFFHDSLPTPIKKKKWVRCLLFSKKYLWCHQRASPIVCRSTSTYTYQMALVPSATITCLQPTAIFSLLTHEYKRVGRSGVKVINWHIRQPIQTAFFTASRVEKLRDIWVTPDASIPFFAIHFNLLHIWWENCRYIS